MYANYFKFEKTKNQGAKCKQLYATKLPKIIHRLFYVIL